MQALRSKDILILEYLSNQEPEGAKLKAIAINVNITQQNAYRYLIKLISRNLARKDTIGTYHIAEGGQIALNGYHVRNTPLQSESFKTRSETRLEQPKPAEPAQATNMHAFEVHYLIYRTEYSRLEAKLADAKIPFKPSGNRKHPSYIIKWEGLRIRLGSRQIIAWGPELTEPITVKHEVIEEKGLKVNIEAVVSLLHKTGIRAQETTDHRLYAQIYYREFAIINNAGIEKLHKNKGYMPIAWDRVTGRASIWMDPTPSTAIETFKGKNHEVLRRWGQGVEDGEIKPYEDEMQTRKELGDIKGVIYDLASETKYLAKNNISHIPYFEQALKKDAIIIELAEALLPIAKARELKEKLEDVKQRRL